MKILLHCKFPFNISCNQKFIVFFISNTYVCICFVKWYELFYRKIVPCCVTVVHWDVWSGWRHWSRVTSLKLLNSPFESNATMMEHVLYSAFMITSLYPQTDMHGKLHLNIFNSIDCVPLLPNMSLISHGYRWPKCTPASNSILSNFLCVYVS